MLFLNTGAAAAWVDTVEKLGTLKIADVLAPAIRLAEEGFVQFDLPRLLCS
jgi:gamma-glutamyltranspeptidase